MLNNLFKCTGSIIKVLFIKIPIEQVQEQGNFIWSLKHLEEWVWRTTSEECVWRNESEEELLKTRQQKQGHQKLVIRSISHQKLLHQSWQRTLYEVYGHKLCNHHVCNVCLYNKTKITVTLLQTLLLLFWNGFELSSS